MFLSLESETQDAALELEASAISSKDDSQYDDQTKLYKKDDVLSKFQTSETFKTCKTPNNISMIQYINKLKQIKLKPIKSKAK